MNLKTLLSLMFAGSIAVAAVARAAGPVTVEMKSLTFNPKQVEITVGQSVQWKNVALTQHSATADDAAKSFDTGLIAPQESSKAIVFDKAGTYPYHCTIHGHTMSGTVVVKAASGSTGQ